MAIKQVFINGGDWVTIETFWNTTTTAFFLNPSGAEIKIRYSGWWFGVDRQEQTLDGVAVKNLTIGRWSFFAARIQIRNPQDTYVVYDVEPGEVANMPPEINI